MTKAKEEEDATKEPVYVTKDPKDGKTHHRLPSPLSLSFHRPSLSSESAHALLLSVDEASLEGSLLRCHFCGVTFSSVEALFAHMSDMGHSGRPDLSGRFLCWKIGCNQYFQSQQSLQLHFG